MTAYRVLINEIGAGPILKWCQEEHGVNRMLVTLRLESYRKKWRPLNAEQEKRTRSLFGQYLLSERLVQGWPVTELVRHPGLAFLIEFNDEVRRIACDAGPRFQDWMPNERQSLPEDICVFRTTAKLPTLVSTTHEGDAWVLSRRRARLPGVVKTNDLEDLKQYIFKGEWFCKDWRERKSQAKS